MIKGGIYWNKRNRKNVLKFINDEHNSVILFKICSYDLNLKYA